MGRGRMGFKTFLTVGGSFGRQACVSLRLEVLLDVEVYAVLNSVYIVCNSVRVPLNSTCLYLFFTVCVYK